MLQPGLEGRNCIADEHYLPTFLHVRLCQLIIFSSHNCTLNSAPYLFWQKHIYSWFVSVGWSWWNCQLVSNSCWLVREKVASEVIQVPGYYLWAAKKLNGTHLQELNLWKQGFLHVCMFSLVFLFTLGFSEFIYKLLLAVAIMLRYFIPIIQLNCMIFSNRWSHYMA